MAGLTANGWQMLLDRLDPDIERAADKYEELRLKLTKFFNWRGCRETDTDSLADEVLDRVGAKLETGEEIRNVTAFALETAKYVWLEYQRKNKEDAAGDDLPEVAVLPDIGEDPDERLICLRKCLAEISNPADCQIILAYYEAEGETKNKDHRRQLAETFALTMNNLKVKASRLRERLEKCIRECLGE